MSKRKEEKGLIAQLKEAIRSSDKTLYQIGKESTVGPEQLYRFMSGKRGLNISAVEKLCRALRLKLVAEPTQPGEQPEPAVEKPGRRTRKGERN
jgi:DNA-binding phage protein